MKQETKIKHFDKRKDLPLNEKRHRLSFSPRL